jgi:hypothetical protein
MALVHTLATLLGSVCLGISAIHAIQAWATDLEAQKFRHPDASAASFLFVPLRWRTGLYLEPGQALVRKAWRHQYRLWLYGLAAALLLLFGNSAW